MTSSTTKDHPPHAKSKPAIKPPATRDTQPIRTAPAASPGGEPDLESRIRLRRAELIGKLRELRADDRPVAGEAGDRLKLKLSEVGHILKDDVTDGWANLSDSVKHKLERWLTESERSLSPENLAGKDGNHEESRQPDRPGRGGPATAK